MKATERLANLKVKKKQAFTPERQINRGSLSKRNQCKSVIHLRRRLRKTMSMAEKSHQREKSFVTKRRKHEKTKKTNALRRDDGWKRYQCDQCDKVFTRQQNLKHHLRTHTGDKPYKCDQCDRAFSQKGNLSCQNTYWRETISV